MLIGLAVIVAGAGFAVIGVAHRASPSTAATPKPVLAVILAAPRHVVWPVSFSAQGAISPWQEASIGAQIGGYPLIEVRVNVGDHVAKGDVLARIDPALLKADEARLAASHAEAEANRRRVVDLQRQAGGAISAMDVLQFVTKAKMAAAELAAKRLQLHYTTIVAPDDGAISARAATLGAVAASGQELFRLIRRDQLEWRGELTAVQLTQVRQGQTITLDLPDGSRAVARVRQTAPDLDPRSRLGIVYADLAPGSRARAGMYANGSVKLGESPALVVPAASVIIRDGRNYVVKPADRGPTPRVTLAEVEVGRRNGADVEIVRGLADSDRVVAQGGAFLNDGDVIRLAAAEGRRPSDAGGKRAR